LVSVGPPAPLAPLVDAADAQLRLALGDATTAVAWAVDSPPMPLPVILGYGGHVFAAGLEAMACAAARILAVQGRVTGDPAILRQAVERLQFADNLAERYGLGWLRLKTQILRALIDDGLGDRDAALGSISDALAQVEPEGCVRPFLDEG